MSSALETKKRLYNKMKVEEFKKLKMKKSKGKRREYKERVDEGNKYTNSLKGCYE